MWHKPQLMTAVSDLLLLAAGAALLVAAVIWGAPRLRLIPLDEVRVTHELREVQRSEIEESLEVLLRGSFFTVNLEALRLSLEQLPWVRRAEVWRKWPARIDINIEEHQAVAHWGDGSGELVNTYGEVFAASLPEERRLPRLDGPKTVTSIRCETKWQGLKLFAVSGADRRDLGVRLGPRGVDRWFAKPVNATQLVREINRELDGALVTA